MSKKEDGGLQVYKPDDNSFLNRMKKSESVQQEAIKNSSTKPKGLEVRRQDLAASEVVISRAISLVQSEDPKIDAKEKEKAFKLAHLAFMEAQVKAQGLLIDCLTVRRPCQVLNEKGEKRKGYMRVPLLDELGQMFYEAFIEGDQHSPNGLVCSRLDSINNHVFVTMMMNYLMQRAEPEMTLKDKFGVESPMFPQCEALIQQVINPPETGSSQHRQTEEMVVDENEGVVAE